MPLGLNGISNVLIPSAWDAAELTRLQLRDGTTYEQIISDVNGALSLVNGELTQGYLARMMSLTTELAVEYRSGVSNGFEDATEFSQPDAKRAETSGHMLPLRSVDRKLGWSVRFLEQARRAQIDADVSSMLDDARNIFEQRVLTRHFKSAEETGRTYGLGAAGVSVPFCNGSVQAIGGSASTAIFVPVPVPARGGAFASSHSHFLRLDGITQANVEAAVYHVWEHGHDGPFELLVSLADLDSWTNATNVTGYVKRADPLVQYGTNVSLANVDQMYIGVVSTKYGPCRMYASGRVPTGYWTVFKSYGDRDQRNPLRVRYDEIFGFGVKLVAERVDMFPLAGAIGRIDFGPGVGEDRTIAVCVKNAGAGNYSDPTIN